MFSHSLDVDVQVRYLSEQSEPQAGRYRFAYTVTLRNLGDVAVQVVARHWIITDANGRTEEVQGFGVVGQQPILRPGATHEYTSSCELRTESGAMQGRYVCVTEEAVAFDAPIPAFALSVDDDGDGADASIARIRHTLH